MSFVKTEASSARLTWLGGSATRQIFNFGTSSPSSTKQNKTPSLRLFNLMKVLPPNAIDVDPPVFFPDLDEEFAPLTFLESTSSSVAQLNSTLEWHGINYRKQQKEMEKEDQNIGYPHACWGMRRLQMRLANS